MGKLGTKQQAALDFIRKCNGWHSYATSERKVIASLATRGLVEDSTKTLQFRLVAEPAIYRCNICGLVISRADWYSGYGSCIRHIA